MLWKSVCAERLESLIHLRSMAIEEPIQSKHVPWLFEALLMMTSLIHLRSMTLDK